MAEPPEPTDRDWGTARRTRASREAHGLLLTGGVGVGKTTIAVEIGVVLGQQSIEHAVIDLDWLSWGAASFDQDRSDHHRRLLIENLHAVWRNYMRHGVRCVVLAGSIISVEHLEGVRAALDEMPLRVVRIRAPLELTVRRLDHRDPASKTSGSLDDLRAFEQLVTKAGLESQVVDNTSGDLSQIALELAAKWLSDQTGRRSPASA
ncbi:MAG: hypothetical protein WAL22_21765 [Solirubrobacteraceae bacterium]